jgi:O-antigen/teichoic acid export membrane protein
MYVTGFMMIANIVLNLWLIPLYGYIGASYVTLACYILSFAIMLAIIIRDFRRPGYLITLNQHTSG